MSFSFSTNNINSPLSLGGFNYSFAMGEVSTGSENGNPGFSWNVGSNSYLNGGSPFGAGMGYYGSVGPFQKIMPGGIWGWNDPVSQAAAPAAQMFGKWGSSDPVGKCAKALLGVNPNALMMGNSQFVKAYTDKVFDDAQKRSSKPSAPKAAPAGEQGIEGDKGGSVGVTDIEEKGYKPNEAQAIFDKAFAGKSADEQQKLIKHLPEANPMANEKAQSLASWYLQAVKSVDYGNINDLYKKAVTKKVKEQKVVSMKGEDGDYFSKDGSSYGEKPKEAKYKSVLKSGEGTVFQTNNEGGWTPVMETVEKAEYDIVKILNKLDILTNGGTLPEVDEDKGVVSKTSGSIVSPN